MKTFLDQQSGAVIGVSLKGMYSFFATDHRFSQIESDDVDFQVVRNPFNRVISFYQDKIINRELTQVCQKVVLAALNSESLKNISLQDLCSVLPDVVSKNDHFHPQYDPRKNVTKVIKIESDLPLLGVELGIDFSRKVNATSHGSAASLLHGSRGVGFIRDVYRLDFAMFGYSLDCLE